MSEAEKKRRHDYRRNRKKWILIQAFAILLVAIIGLSMFITYYKLNETYYISYTENGSSSYNVSLKDNEFFDSSTVESGKGYISEIIDKVNADFKYTVQMENVSAKFVHSHYVEAKLEIVDNHTKAVLYQPTFTLADRITATENRQNVNISESVSVDYHEYDEMAQKFINAYGLTSVTTNLIITMYVDIEGSNSQFECNAANTYSTSVVIPLREQTISISTASSSAGDQTHTLACKRDIDPEIFKIIAIICAALCVVGGAILTAFVLLTRNEDINYEIKVKKLLNSYRSYIQIITNEFDSEGYQLLSISTFNEMLAIRDTIQSPILMNENEDKTRTLFLIPTNTKILYVFEIKVENYDELYIEINSVDEAPSEEDMQNDGPVILEEVDPAELEEALAQPEFTLDTIDYIEDDDEELDVGVEVIGVVWPEHKSKNKVYKYNPNGETVDTGDIVLVPSRDESRDKDVIRKATVAHGNHLVDPETIHFPLKRIIGVVKKSLRSQLEK